DGRGMASTLVHPTRLPMLALGASPSTTRVVPELTEAQWVGTESASMVRLPIHVPSPRLSKTVAKLPAPVQFAERLRRPKRQPQRAPTRPSSVDIKGGVARFPTQEPGSVEHRVLLVLAKQ